MIRRTHAVPPPDTSPDDVPDYSACNFGLLPLPAELAGGQVLFRWRREFPLVDLPAWWDNDEVVGSGIDVLFAVTGRCCLDDVFDAACGALAGADRLPPAGEAAAGVLTRCAAVADGRASLFVAASAAADGASLPRRVGFPDCRVFVYAEGYDWARPVVGAWSRLSAFGVGLAAALTSRELSFLWNDQGLDNNWRYGPAGLNALPTRRPPALALAAGAPPGRPRPSRWRR